MADPKAESERLYDIGARYFSQGNKDKAKQFLERAEKLQPSKKIRDLLNQLNGGNASASAPNKQKTQADSASSSKGQNGTDHASTDTRPQFTAEQLTEVQRVRRCRDYYEILQVEKTASEDEVKRAYRKLALKMHPDKNNAPGATEAFRAVSNAFGVLSDAQKRRQYDLQGPSDFDHSTMRDGAAAARGGARRRYAHNGEYYEYDFTRGFESDMSAEDIFNMFFGGGLFANDDQHVYTYRNGHAHHADPRRRENVYRGRADGSNYMLWLQIAPFIALIVLSLLSSVFRSEPPFSLTQTSRYSDARSTSNLHIRYFVKSDFNEQYGEKVGSVEQEVENEYYNALRSKCYNEQAYRESVMYRARLYGDMAAYNQARSMALPSCDEVKRLSSY